MKLADRCQHAFASQDRQRGKSYFDSGAVDLVETDGSGATSFVAGSFDKPISGAQVEEIAARMIASAEHVTALASGREKVS